MLAAVRCVRCWCAAEYVKRYASAAISLGGEEEEDGGHGRGKGRSSSSSFSSSASTDGESPSPASSPVVQPSLPGELQLDPDVAWTALYSRADPVSWSSLLVLQAGRGRSCVWRACQEPQDRRRAAAGRAERAREARTERRRKVSGWSGAAPT